ncbi:protein kinase [Marinihelvus fidelis]|uniref:Protein kinase n=1 Tax=Marinihelvus fidelis TaxID=2613842 RepID=A0A5N0T825_9GAMM|nr:serine/threonine-protein kinase [Marinihelvus fidelis]KAA9130297.1 protein kinase [Marinihelvus fidelis]
MSGVEDRWRQIADAFDRDDSLDPDAWLESQGLGFRPLGDRVADDTPELVQHAFLPNESLEDIELSKYRILKQLDEGGQGQVYLAERSDGIYQQSVVIKFLPRRFAGQAMRERFFREMQFLADLRHPGIVPIIDAGLTEGGQPWLVLEYIDGPHIDRFCHESCLDAESVVRLFTRLCDALDFIHLRGVVHMDLKPANVLVREANGVAYPVIIDFGVSSRQVDSDADTAKARFGTPGYAAPEQAEGEAADARADLYAVGMMLARSMPGCNDLELTGIGARQREQRLRHKGVPPDLVQVIQACTRHRPESRYADAAALRFDLNNWLQGLPLVANRQRPLHVLGKAVRRHPLFSTAALLAGVLLVGGIGRYTADIQELQQLTQAEKNAGDEFYNFVLTDLFDRLVRIGRVDALELVASRGVDHLSGQDPRIFDDHTRLQTALAYRNSGRVFDQLESSEQALLAYDQAEANLANLADKPGFHEEYLRTLASIDVLRAETLATEGQGEKTEQSLRRALSLTGQLADTGTDEARRLAWEAHLLLGWHYMEYDQPEKADTEIRSSTATAASALAGAGSESGAANRWRLRLSHTHQAMAWHHFDYGAPEDAMTSIEQALVLARETVDATGEDIEFLSNYRILLNQKAFFLLDGGDLGQAQSTTDEAIAAGERLALMAPENLEYRREFAYSLTTGGEIAEAMGDDERALALYRRGLEGSRDIAARDSGGYSSANDLAIDLTSVANVLSRLGHQQESQVMWREAVELMRPVQQAEPDNKYYVYSLAIPLIQLGQYDEAAPLVATLRDTGMEDETLQALLDQHGLR